MQRTIPAETLERLEDLITENDYEVPDEDDDEYTPSVIDSALEYFVWPDAVPDISDSEEMLDKLSEWLIPCRVQKITLEPNEDFTAGPYDGDGAIIQPDTGSISPGYWILVNTDDGSLPDDDYTEVDIPGGDEIEFPENYVQIYGEEDRWMLSTDDDHNDYKRSELLEEGQYDNWYRYDGGDSSTIGPFQEGAIAYVGFPRPGVIEFPDWFVDEDFEGVDDLALVDRALRIGGGFSGISAHIETGGFQSYVSLPGFARPFLGDTDVHFDIPSVVRRLDLPGPFGGKVTADVDHLHWNPAEGDDSIDIDFVEKAGKPAVEFAIELDASDTTGEIEVTNFPENILNMEHLSVKLYLIMDVREERLHWTPEAEAEADVSPSGLDGPDLDKIEDAMKSAVESNVKNLLPSYLLDSICSWMFSLPARREFPEKPDDIDDYHWSDEDEYREFMKDPQFMLLLDMMDNHPESVGHSPDFPTSLLPSSLRQVIFDRPQRVLDRFVRYNDVSIEPDPETAGKNRLVVDYEFFDAHNPPDDQDYTHETIPRETFSIKPLRTRPEGVRTEWEQKWINYTRDELPDLVDLITESEQLIVNPERYLPKLNFDYQIKSSHEILEDSEFSKIWEDDHSYQLVSLQRIPLQGDNPMEHYNDGELQLSDAIGQLHHLEMPSVLIGEPDETHKSSVIVLGSASLEYWKEKEQSTGFWSDILQNDDVSGLVAFVLAIISLILNVFQSGQPSTPSDEPDPVEETTSYIDENYEKEKIDLGEFPSSIDEDESQNLDEESGLATDTATGNEFTITGEKLEVDFLLERHSVNPDEYDWINVAFRSFDLAVEPRHKEDEEVLSELANGEPFEVVAYLQGEELARARYVHSPDSWSAGTILRTHRPNQLEGEPWKRELYFPKVEEDSTAEDSIGVRFEVRRDNQKLTEVSADWPRYEGESWTEKTEWGIPKGHSSVLRTLENPDGTLSVDVEIGNELDSHQDVPIEHRPKELDVSFDEVYVSGDSDLGSGELQYWVEVQKKTPGEEGFHRVSDEVKSSVMSLDKGDTEDLELKSQEVDFKPLDTLRIWANGKEHDLLWDDYLGGESVDQEVTFDDEQDGGIELKTDDYEIENTIDTLSEPPQPLLHVSVDGDDWRDDLATEPDDSGVIDVKLRIRASWLDSLELREYRATDEEEPEEAPTTTRELPAPLPKDLYDPPLGGDATLTLADADDPKDFTYYYELSTAISPGTSLFYRLLAESDDRYSVSDYVQISAVDSN